MRGDAPVGRKGQREKSGQEGGEKSDAGETKGGKGAKGTAETRWLVNKKRSTFARKVARRARSLLGVSHFGRIIAPVTSFFQ